MEAFRKEETKGGECEHECFFGIVERVHVAQRARRFSIVHSGDFVSCGTAKRSRAHSRARSFPV